MPTQECVFNQFRQFPTEIRRAIWRHCLPNRLMELDDQDEELTWDERACGMNWKITRTNAAPPIIARVCRESRAVAFERGRPQLLPDETHTETQRFSNYMIKDPWLDTMRDSVHLNWEPAVDIEWQSYDWGDPVCCLIWYARRTLSHQASIMLSFLQAFRYQDNPNQPHEHYRWTRSELADLMRVQPSWMVVVLPPVVVHADPKTTAGLFGLLADARVQLVDADDEARINEFMALGGAPNATIGPRFWQEDLVSAKEELRDAVKAVFGSEDSAPAMLPAVMFRLCTRMCM